MEARNLGTPHGRVCHTNKKRFHVCADALSSPEYQHHAKLWTNPPQVSCGPGQVTMRNWLLPLILEQFLSVVRSTLANFSVSPLTASVCIFLSFFRIRTQRYGPTETPSQQRNTPIQDAQRACRCPALWGVPHYR